MSLGAPHYSREIRFTSGPASGQCKGSVSGSHSWFKKPSDEKATCHFCTAQKTPDYDTCTISENFLVPIWTKEDERIYHAELKAENLLPKKSIILMGEAKS